jgi:hypothetical protein
LNTGRSSCCERQRLPWRTESRIEFPNAVVRLVIEQQEIDLGRLEPRHHHVLAQIDQLGEFEPQRASSSHCPVSPVRLSVIDSNRSSAGDKCSTKMTGISVSPAARAASTTPWP